MNPCHPHPETNLLPGRSIVVSIFSNLLGGVGPEWTSLLNWASAVSELPAPETTPTIPEIKGRLAECLQENAETRALGVRLAALPLGDVKPWLDRLKDTGAVRRISRQLPAELVASLEMSTETLKAAKHPAGTETPRPFLNATTTAKMTLFFLTSSAHRFTNPVDVTVAEGGTPSPQWQRIVETAYEEGVAIHLKNKRTGNNAVFLPGRSNLGDLMMLVADPRDVLEMTFRMADGPRARDQAHRVARLTKRILEDRLEPWEETESKVRIATGYISQIAREQLEPEEIAVVVRDIEKAGTALIVLEVEGTRPGRSMILRSGEPAQNRSKLASLILHPGNKLKIRVSAISAMFLCHRLMSAYLGDNVPLADPREQSIPFTISPMGQALLASEVSERYIGRRERDKRDVLVNLDSQAILLYRGEDVTTPPEMMELWNLMTGKSSKMAAATLSLADRHFRITASGANQSLTKEELRRARNILLYQLVARWPTLSIPEGSNFNGPRGYIIRLDQLESRRAERQPRSYEERRRLIEDLRLTTFGIERRR